MTPYARGRIGGEAMATARLPFDGRAAVLPWFRAVRSLCSKRVGRKEQQRKLGLGRAGCGTERKVGRESWLWKNSRLKINERMRHFFHRVV